VSTVDVIAVAAAALTVLAVCGAFLAGTHGRPTTTRTVGTLAVTAGLCALVVVVAVPVALTAAGQGDPLGAPGGIVTASLETLGRPLTIVVVVLAADVGFLLAWLRMRREQRGAR